MHICLYSTIVEGDVLARSGYKKPLPVPRAQICTRPVLDPTDAPPSAALCPSGAMRYSTAFARLGQGVSIAKA